MNLSRGYTTPMLILSVISMVSSFPMIISYALFREMRTESHYQIIFYISVSNFLSNLGSSFGEPVGGSAPCWLEGLLTNIFPLSSMLWSMQLSFMIFHIVYYTKVSQVDWRHHLMCWFLPVSVSLLPLINASYGPLGDDGVGWCYIVETKSTPSWAILFWYWFSFYFIICCGIFGMVVLSSLSVYRFVSIRPDISGPLWRIILHTWAYPAIVAISWGSALVYDNITSTEDGSKFQGAKIVYLLSIIIPCLQGFFTGVLFWFTNKPIQQKLRALICGGGLLPPDQPEEVREAVGGAQRSSGIRGRHISSLQIPSDPPSFFEQISRKLDALQESSSSLLKSIPRSSADQHLESIHENIEISTPYEHLEAAIDEDTNLELEDGVKNDTSKRSINMAPLTNEELIIVNGCGDPKPVDAEITTNVPGGHLHSNAGGKDTMPVSTPSFSLGLKPSLSPSSKILPHPLSELSRDEIHPDPSTEQLSDATTSLCAPRGKGIRNKVAPLQLDTGDCAVEETGA